MCLCVKHKHIWPKQTHAHSEGTIFCPYPISDTIGGLRGVVHAACNACACKQANKHHAMHISCTCTHPTIRCASAARNAAFCVCSRRKKRSAWPASQVRSHGQRRQGCVVTCEESGLRSPQLLRWQLDRAGCQPVCRHATIKAVTMNFSNSSSKITKKINNHS